MSEDLAKALTDFAKSRNFSCTYIPPQAANIIIENFAQFFGLDLLHRYIWEDVHIERRLEYDNNYPLWKQEISLMLEMFDQQVYLVVTDDEFFPWPVFHCKRVEVIEILQEHHFFEFFIFDDSMKYLLFDTHENQLLLASRRI